MNARAVNVAILLLLVFGLGTGLGSFLIGSSDVQWVFWFHRAGGLALVLLVAWKIGIAGRSYRRRGVTGSARYSPPALSSSSVSGR